MGRPIVHWELMSKDPAKVASFYEKIFGWKVPLFTDPEG
jgi:predicted enzyme related to lactoylglutathione lyase